MAAPKKTRRAVLGGSSKTAPAAPVTRAAATPDQDVRLLRLRELVKILEASALAELSYEDQDISVSLHRHSSGGFASGFPQMQAQGHAPPPPSPAAAPAHVSAPVAAVADDADMVLVKSPFVGTFYRSPRPGQPMFADVGDKIRRGQTLCIIEAMKLMNEIESEVDGTVVAIVAENGKPVQYGDTLFKIKKG